MKLLEQVSIREIRRMEIYINEDRLPLRDIVAREVPDLIFTGVFYTADWMPTCHLKAGGKVLADDPSYQPPGLVWDEGPDLRWGTVPDPAARNYASCCTLIVNGRPEPKLYYNGDVGGRRGRVAAWLSGRELGVYACTDGADALTPEALRDEIWSRFRPEFAVMFDGGGKVNAYSKGQGVTIQGSAPSQDLIAIWLDKGEERPDMDSHTVCLDPGHGPGTVNTSPDGTYSESEFAWDLYERTAKLLAERGVRTVCTRAENNKPSLTERCAVSNNAGADCFVSIHTNAFGSGWTSASGLELYTSSGPDTAPRNVLAAKLTERFRAAGVKLRQSPVKHSMDMTVLTKTDAPAVLIEYGYHTNEEDVALLKDSAYRDKLARATTDGICDFLGVEVPGGPVPDEPDEWAAEEWEAAKKAGILDGTRPHAPLTRQEAAVILERLGLLD